MCLLTRQKEPFIAQEDIPVFKVLTNGRKAVMWNFLYELGVLYKTEIKQSFTIIAADDTDTDYWRINAHTLPFTMDRTIISYAQGFHSMKTLDRARLLLRDYGFDNVIYHAVIPKGSEYYENPTGLFISNQLIVNDEQ